MHENCKSHHSPRWWKLPVCSFSRDSCSTAWAIWLPLFQGPCPGKWTIFPGSFPRSGSSLVLSRQLRSLAEASTLLHVLFVHMSDWHFSSIKANTGAKAWWLCLLPKETLHRLRGRLPRSQLTLLCSYTLNCRLEMTFGLILSAFDIVISKQRQTTVHLPPFELYY